MAEDEVFDPDQESTQNDYSGNKKSSYEEKAVVKEEDEKSRDIEEQNNETVKLDGGWGWMVCLGAFVTNFVVFGIHNSFGVIYGTLKRELEISSAETAWIGSLGMGLNFFFGPISSALCERIGCRLTTLTGAVLAVSGLLLSSFITRKDVSKMYATYGVMWGVGSSLCYVSSMVVLGQYFNKRMAIANGLGTSGSGVGTLIMAPVIQKLLSSLGWRTAFRFLSGVSSSLFIAVWLFKPLPGKQVKNEESAHPCVDLNIWRNKAYIVWVMSISFFLFGYFIPFVHLIRLADLLGVPGSKAAWLISYLSIASTLGRVFFGKVGDLKQVNRLVMFQVSILIIGASTGFLALAKGYTALVFYALTFGFFDGCFVGQVAVVTSTIVGMKHLGVALGYLFGSIALPMTLGPPVAGWIYDGSQSYNVAFYVAGATSFLGFLTMFLIPRLVKKYAESWEKQFEFKRRASIESRRKLLSSTLPDGGFDPLARNSLYEVDVFAPEENSEGASCVPLPQISVERPNYTRGRRRSLPALYISNNPSPHLTHFDREKPPSSPAFKKIARLSDEIGNGTHFRGLDDRASSNESPVFAPVFRSGTNSASEKQRPNRTHVRRGSLPVISHKSGLQGNVSQPESKAPRMAQVLLVDANLLAQHGIPLVSVNALPTMNRNKRRGSLPAVHHPNSSAVANSRPRTYDLGRRRGSLPAVSLPVPKLSDDSARAQKLDSNGFGEKSRLSKPLTLNLQKSGSREEAIEEGEEDEEGHKRILVDGLGKEKTRLSTSSGYCTNGNINGSPVSGTSLGDERKDRK